MTGSSRCHAIFQKPAWPGRTHVSPTSSRICGGVPVAVEPERKVLYHVAAVFSHNVATVLQAIAGTAGTETGVSEDMPDRLGNTRLAETSGSVTAWAPPRRALQCAA